MSWRSVPFEVGSYEAFERFERVPGAGNYRARHLISGHEVVLHDERWWQDGAGEQRTALRAAVLRARRFQAELLHPNVLGVKDVVDHDGSTFTAFQRLPPGTSLSAALEEPDESRSLDSFRRLCEGVVAGLAAVHGEGWLHGGVHAGNYWLNATGQPLVISLGLARPVEEGIQPVGGEYMAVVPEAMPPETLDDAEPSAGQSIASDLWSLGVLLFRARYGRHPLARVGRRPAIGTVLLALQQDDISFPAADDPGGGFPEHEETLLRPWIETLLRKDPRERPRDAVEALRSLDAVLSELDDRPPLARAFVAMPFAAEFDPLWMELRMICAEARVAVQRGDEVYTRDDIWDDVAQGITRADFVIAVCAQDRGQVNPNVMLEVGFARALSKPTLLLTDDVDALPFDLRMQRALVYDPDEIASRSFRGRLAQLIEALVAR